MPFEWLRVFQCHLPTCGVQRGGFELVVRGMCISVVGGVGLVWNDFVALLPPVPVTLLIVVGFLEKVFCNYHTRSAFLHGLSVGTWEC